MNNLSLSKQKHKKLFLEEKYVFISFDYSSTAFWDTSGCNIPLKWFDWDFSHSSRFITALDSLRYVFNSSPTPFSQADANAGVYAVEYVIEHLLEISYELKKQRPEWTIEMNNLYHFPKPVELLEITLDMDITQLINQRRMNTLTGQTILICD